MLPPARTTTSPMDGPISEEERVELHREADEAEAEYVRSECIPLDDVLPRYRQAG